MRVLTLLYGSKNWVLINKDIARIQVPKIKFLRRVIGVILRDQSFRNRKESED